MKRFIIIECDTDMSSMFVSIHEGPARCMTPLMARTVEEQCRLAVSAVSTENLVGSRMTRSQLLLLLERCIFHKDWKYDTDWQGNRVHYGRNVEPSFGWAMVDQGELILSDVAGVAA